MADDRSALDHDTFYLSWSDGEGHPDQPVEFARGLASELRLPLTVVAQTMTDMPDDLKADGYVTARSARPATGPAVVLLFYPSYQLIRRPRGSAAKLVAAEWPEDPLRTWAARRGAYDVRAGETMKLDLADDVRETYDRILWNGNNGWSDKPGKRDALYDLRELRGRGLLNKEELIGYLLSEKRWRSLEQLATLIDRVHAEPMPAPEEI